MSRDQRPGRAAMVQSAPDGPASDPAAAAVGITDTAQVPAAAARPPVLLWCILFLLACAAGAVAVAVLMPEYAV